MDDGLLLDFSSPCGEYRLTFEDDGKVAYAYLKQGKSIVGDLWLYNRRPTPEKPEWTDRSKIPFANSKEYVQPEGHLTKAVSGCDVLVEWEYVDQVPVAYIYVFEDLYGVVSVGYKPGYARYAAKDGRLARVMKIEDD